MTSLIVRRMCSRESLSTRKISCAEMNVFQVHHLCFRNCGLRINTLIYLSPRLQLVCEQRFAEEIRQKAFKSHINLKLASALSCSLYFYVANSKNFPTSVWSDTVKACVLGNPDGSLFVRLQRPKRIRNEMHHNFSPSLECLQDVKGAFSVWDSDVRESFLWQLSLTPIVPLFYLEGTMPTDNELLSIQGFKSNIRSSLIIQCDKFITLKVLWGN